MIERRGAIVRLAAMIILTLLLAGCSEEYAGDRPPQLNEIRDADNPELSTARDMLAAALRYDIDRFVRRNRPEMKSCFLSILGADPADDLLARLEGAGLEVHKFSEWSFRFKDENGMWTNPGRYILISVRDGRIMDSTHGEVDTAWNVSGNDIPGETFILEKFADAWRVTDVKLTP